MLVSAQEGYRLWAETFDASPNPLVALDRRELAPWLSEIRGKRIIDVCCGTGRWLGWLNALGASAFGCDLSREMLVVQRHALQLPVVQSDALQLPFATGIADTVLCNLSLGYLNPARSAMQEMRRITRPGGVVIVTDVHPDAIRKGWRRTFQHSGITCEIENHPASLDELSIDGLVLEEQRSVHFGEPERPIFEAAGKPAKFFNEARETPALWMLRWRAQ